MISVIMSLFNESFDWIRQSIESIRNQTVENTEIIIIVDNPDISKDIRGYLEEVRKIDGRIVISYNDNNIGLPLSLNKAIKLSTGEYIARMDADDVSFDTRLEEELEYLKTNNLDIVASQVEYIDEEGKVIGHSSLKARNPHKALQYKNNINHPTVFAKARVYKELNGYRDMVNSEDYDMWLRAIDRGYRIGILNRYLLQYRIRTQGITVSRGLEQFYAGCYIKKLHKERTKNGADTYTKNNMQEYIHSHSLSDNRKKRYKSASDSLVRAIEKKREGKASFVICFCKTAIQFPPLAAEAIKYELCT